MPDPLKPLRVLVSEGSSTSAREAITAAVILGSAPGEEYVSAAGDLRAFDVITGKLVWQFHTVPHPGH
jgi:hypothetical protein